MKNKKFLYIDGRVMSDDYPTMPISCLTCVHYNVDKSCKAFPERIPMPILSGQILHTSSLWNDNGIQYEPKFPEEKNT